MMYVTDGWGSVYKFDVRKNGKLVWKMNPDTDHDFPELLPVAVLIIEV